MGAGLQRARLAGQDAVADDVVQRADAGGKDVVRIDQALVGVRADGQQVLLRGRGEDAKAGAARRLPLK